MQGSFFSLALPVRISAAAMDVQVSEVGMAEMTSADSPIPAPFCPDPGHFLPKGRVPIRQLQIGHHETSVSFAGRSRNDCRATVLLPWAEASPPLLVWWSCFHDPQSLIVRQASLGWSFLFFFPSSADFHPLVPSLLHFLCLCGVYAGAAGT